MWDWIAALKPSQALVLGASVSSFLGFTTLALGALLNAYLNRRRDRSLHKFEQLNLLRALVIEIARISMLLRYQIKKIETVDQHIVSLSLINPLSLTTIYASNTSKLHILPPITLYQIIPFYTALYEHEYNMIVQGAQLIGSKEDKFKAFNLNSCQRDGIMKLNQDLDAKCQIALAVCYPLIKNHYS